MREEWSCGDGSFDMYRVGDGGEGGSKWVQVGASANTI